MKRNVAVIILDAVRKDYFGEYAPRLRSLSDVEYHACRSASFWSVPSHASLFTGFLNDDQSLALLYVAADVMVVPSRYEGFGQPVFEALACGTPVAAFDATGPREQITHRETGWLAEPYDPSGLATGIRWLFDDPERRAAVGERARETVIERYDRRDVARAYLGLYREVTVGS